MRYFSAKKSGFTLIELIVSVGIFSVVMVIALGALLSISAAERKAETLKAVMNNLNFVLESMSRQIRTGYAYGCPLTGDCPSGSYQVRFTSADSGAPQYTYCLNSGTGSITCGTSTACPANNTCSILRSKSGGVVEPLSALTPPEVAIKNLAFIVRGSPPGNQVQPIVTILISGYVQVTASQQTTFNLQTSMTQRIYDQ